jgi:hypothetical protein
MNIIFGNMKSCVKFAVKQVVHAKSLAYCIFSVPHGRG